MSETTASHVSIEIDHFYPKDFARGPEIIEQRLRHAARFIGAIASGYEHRYPGAKLRISTCFMVDDYQKLQDTTPQGIINETLLPAATAAGVQIDYIGREAGCAELAPAFMETLIDRYSHATFGRKTVQHTGWLANGSAQPNIANAWQGPWPATTQRLGATPAANRHRGGIFEDIELVNKSGWACPYLASIWQALRLGSFNPPSANPQKLQLDTNGSPVFGDSWGALPILMQLNPGAAPFAAYSSYSVLPTEYMPIETAVDTILRTHNEEPHMHNLAGKEQITLLPVAERKSYAFFNADDAELVT